MATGETDLFFGAETPLRQASRFGGPSYEQRPEQFAMAHRVAQALDNHEQLLIEAPTGIGKTFAYLVPALCHAAETGKPVLVSTHTISLQEQILRKDVPLLSRLLNRNIACHIAKGRANYLCRFRLDQMLRQSSPPLPGSWLAALIRWSDQTKTGDREEFPLAGSRIGAWHELSCDSFNCQGTLCPHYRKDCYHLLARRRLAEAELIVANHAFLFTVLAHEDPETPILPDFSALILDEGHTIPDIAAAQFGCHPGTWELRRLILAITRENQPGGLLGKNDSTQVLEQANAFLSALAALQPKLVDYLRQQDGVSGGLLRLTHPIPEQDGFSEPLTQLAGALTRLAISCEATDAERATALRKRAEELLEFAKNIQDFFQAATPDMAYWFEIRGRNNTEVSFEAVPIDPAPKLHQLLSRGFTNAESEESEPLPVIVTSATLTINGSMDYFRRRIGLPDAQTLVLDSPFDFEEQVTLYMPGMPAPQDFDFQEALLEQLKHYLELTRGRAFVLFTSYQQMRRTAESLQEFFMAGDYHLLVQGNDLSPRQMLAEFKKLPKAVIFGTDSFWTGVDVPGDALSNVIITQLPFAQLGHPIQQARDEQCRARGGKPFPEITLPEAVLKFRQGFGRLIRTRQDRGIIVLLDGRLRQKSYGAIFLNSIPRCRDGLAAP